MNRLQFGMGCSCGNWTWGAVYYGGFYIDILCPAGHPVDTIGLPGPLSLTDESDQRILRNLLFDWMDTSGGSESVREYLLVCGCVRSHRHE